MPLDAIKAAHITALRARAQANRTRSVVFVTLSGTTYSYTAVSVVFKFVRIYDPEIQNIHGAEPKLESDAIVLIPISQSVAGLLYIADTTTATSGAVAAANKYEAVEILPLGILPASTHYEISLRRMH
jgi:hypothetical protein